MVSLILADSVLCVLRDRSDSQLTGFLSLSLMTAALSGHRFQERGHRPVLLMLVAEGIFFPL